MDALPILLVLGRAVGILLAVSITVTSARAYRRTERPAHLYSVVGFGLLGAGLALESVLLETVALPITTVHSIESVVFALGFVALHVSLNGFTWP
ncbi:MAG: hypothetical protein ABEJ76_00340 [Halanaeroarchaeum sp.]